MEITKEQDTVIQAMQSMAVRVVSLRKQLESIETGLNSKAKEFFKEVFGTGIETRPIFVFDRSTLGSRLSLSKSIR